LIGAGDSQIEGFIPEDTSIPLKLKKTPPGTPREFNSLSAKQNYWTSVKRRRKQMTIGRNSLKSPSARVQEGMTEVEIVSTELKVAKSRFLLLPELFVTTSPAGTADSP
jgi:hypothetical protein